MPQAIDSFARLYMGADAMASNGLRYGAAFEFRQNFIGQISNNGSSGASGYSSFETVFVRRAFTYVAGEQWGIVRVGQADGLISIFDNGVTTFQFTPTGNLNGGDLQNMVGGVAPAFVFLAQAGNEYDNAKAVYLSPQIAGFDFGIQYAPNTSNGNGIGSANIAPLVNSLQGTGTGTGNSCGTVNTGCPTLSSGPGIQDGSRSINQAAIGVRYQGQFGPTGLLAYVVGEGSQHATYTGATTADVLGNTAVPGSKFNGSYNDLAIGSAGVAATFAGFTVGGNVVGGQMNGQLGLQPKGGAPLVGVLAGVKYVAGPFTVGVVGEEFWEQGNVNLSGISQLRGRGDRRCRQLHRGARLHRVCRVYLERPDPGCPQLRHRRDRNGGRLEPEQQHPRPGLPGRQRGQLLSPSRLAAKTGGGVISPPLFLALLAGTQPSIFVALIVAMGDLCSYWGLLREQRRPAFLDDCTWHSGAVRGRWAILQWLDSRRIVAACDAALGT